MSVKTGAFGKIRRLAHCAAPIICIGFFQSAEAEETDARAEDLRTVLFGSLDTGQSTFATLGVKRTLLGPLDQTGWLGMASIGYGATGERVALQPETPRIMRHAIHATALLGYQWVSDGIVVAALAGPEVDGEQVIDSVTVPRLAQPHVGVRLHGEIWAHPTANTLLTTTVIAGTARTPHLWGRISAGYRMWGEIYFGPEVSVYTTDAYREWRVGAHLTGLALGPFSLRLSAGWRGEEDTRRDGAYIGLAGHIRM